MSAIIIGFTPFHLLPMRELLAAIEDDLHVFHPMADQIRALAAGRRVKFLGGCDSAARSRWARYFHARREIDRLMDRGQVDLYVPHPFNPLSNHAFFHAGPSRRFIYQDGILNYYDAAPPLASLSARMRQRAKASVIGARYRMYGGHLSGIDNGPVAGGFFTHPDRIVRSEKFSSLRRLEFRSEGGSAEPRADVLFLDQPLESILDAARSRELRRRTIEYANALGGRVYYKPHYAQGQAVSFAPGWTALAHDWNVLPAEWVVGRLRPAHVVSYCTSALANIAMSDNAIACHATAANLIQVSVNGRPTTLAEVLSGLGVSAVGLLEA